MRIRSILILALFALILALAAGCTSTTTGSADSAKVQPTGTAAPVAQTTPEIVPSVQTASISGSAIVGCAPGSTPCGNACVNLKTNSSNCGSCGDTCPVDKPMCREGQCISP